MVVVIDIDGLFVSRDSVDLYYFKVVWVLVGEWFNLYKVIFEDLKDEIL